jgi:hypothetical protein
MVLPKFSRVMSWGSGPPVFVNLHGSGYAINPDVNGFGNENPAKKSAHMTKDGVGAARSR